MSKNDTKPEDLAPHAKALHAAINAVPAAERAYLVRYVTLNAHRPLAEMLSRWDADRESREEAAELQRHRDEKVMGDALEAAKRLGVEVALAGPGSDALTQPVDAKGE